MNICLLTPDREPVIDWGYLQELWAKGHVQEQK